MPSREILATAKPSELRHQSTRCSILRCDDTKYKQRGNNGLCKQHVNAVDNGAVMSCGCEEPFCDDCRFFAQYNTRVLIIGERYYLPPSGARVTSIPFDSPMYVKLMLGLGAFKWPETRALLHSCGLRWDESLYLVHGQDVWGHWTLEDRHTAKKAATQLLILNHAAPYSAENPRWHLIIVAGRAAVQAVVPSGRHAYSTATVPFFKAPHYLVVPHPSSVNQIWQDTTKLDAVRKLFREKLAAMSTSSIES